MDQRSGTDAASRLPTKLAVGNLPQIRSAIAEEIESALAGKESAKDALDKAKTRGDVILRNFEKTAG